MNKDEYKKLVNSLTPKENKNKHMIIAFLAGGIMGVLAELSVVFLTSCFALSRTDAYQYTCLFIILFGCFFTAVGFFDNWVSKAKAGLIIPTTGFAHAVMSAGLDYKRDGFITGIGANFFKLSGSVILYGIVSAFFFGILGVIFYG